MVLVVAGIVPILCLCGFTLSQVIVAARKRDDALTARDGVHNFGTIAEVIQALMVTLVRRHLYNKGYSLSFNSSSRVRLLLNKCVLFSNPHQEFFSNFCQKTCKIRKTHWS